LREAPEGAGERSRALRRQIYAAIEKTRERPLLVYFADTDNPLKVKLSGIDFNDIDGFTDLVNKCERSRSVDVILHSLGGEAEVAERIVKILRAKFETVHFLIPHSAYSAATMLALSGDSITLYPTATLGPIDPQIDGGPAATITHGFENAKKAIKTDPDLIPAYSPLIEQYSLDLLEECRHATELSEVLVKSWLEKYMFKGQKGNKKTIKDAVDFFSDFNKHHTHSRPIGWDEVKDMGLKIGLAEGKLANLLREAYILLKGHFSATPLAKLYESSNVSYGHSIPRTLPASYSQDVQKAQERLKQILKDLPSEQLEQVQKGLQEIMPGAAR